MSVITAPSYYPYVRPSVRDRPTVTALTVDLSRAAKDLSRAAKDPRLAASHLLIDQISALPENWDGHGSTTPNQFAVERARQLVEDAFLDTATTGWQSPYISASEDGDIVFEWWNGALKLTIYVGPERSTYLKSWGPHVVNDMEDGELAQNWDPGLWLWLFG